MEAMGPEKAPEVRVDAALMKLLASDTRRNVLRRLKNRNMTLSELSRALDLKKATVLEHLKRLEEAELIKRREDERLWIYYELTPRARSLVDPVGTRVMIVLGVTLVALLVGATIGLVAQPWLGGTGPDDETFSVQLDEDEFTSGSAFTMSASFADVAPSGDVQGWLLAPDQADRLRAGDDWVPVAALEVQRQAEEIALTGPEDLPPGSYHVYLVASDGTDNRHVMPLVHVRPLSAEFSRTIWWQGLDDDLNVRLRGSPGPGEEGWLLVSPPAGTPWLEAVSQGEGDVEAGRLDASATGIHRLHYVGPGENRLVPVANDFSVQTPRIHVLPPLLLEGDDVEVHVLLDAEGHARPTNVPVRIDGERHEAESETPGRWVLQVDDARPGVLHVQVGRHHETELTVLPDLRLSALLEDGPRYRFLLEDRHGDPAPGVELEFNGTRLGTTDTNGELVRFEPLPEGPGLLQATTNEDHTTAWGVTVTRDGWGIENRERSLELRDFIEEELILDVRNLDAWPVTATLVGMLDDEVVGATAITLDGEANSTVALYHAYSQAEGREWSVHAEGIPIRPVVYEDRIDPPPPSAPGGGGGSVADGEEPPTLFGPRISKRLVDYVMDEPVFGDEPDDVDDDAIPADDDATEPPASGDDGETEEEATPLPAILLLLGIAIALVGVLRSRRS